MNNKLSQRHYSVLAICLHWLLAFVLAFQLGLGWLMKELKLNEGLYEATQFHKSIGITILSLSLARLGLRFFKQTPEQFSDDRWALILSKSTHFALYAFMIGAPISGWLMVSSSKLNIDTYLFGLLYWPHIPGIETLSVGLRDELNDLSKSAHMFLAWMGIGLFILHIAGALRHQYFKDEPILFRMLPVKSLRRKLMGSAVIMLAVIFLGVSFITIYIFGDILWSNDNIIRKENSVIRAETVDQKALKKDIDNALSKVDLINDDSDQKDIIEKEETSDKNIVIDKAIKPYEWKLSEKKDLSFSVKWNDNVVTGSFSDWTADIVFASNALEESSVNVEVNLSSVTTSDSSANNAITGIDFFDIKAFPQAKFTSNKIIFVGDNRYELIGVLKLKNIEQPVRINFSLDENSRKAEVSGNAMINRIDHKIGETGYGEIDEMVKISFDFTADR